MENLYRIIGYKLMDLLIERNKKSKKLNPEELFYSLMEEKTVLVNFIKYLRKEVLPAAENKINLLHKEHLPGAVEVFEENDIRIFKYNIKDLHRIHNKWFELYKRLEKENITNKLAVKKMVIIDI